MSSTGELPYWRLSSFYFFYFALLGAWMPFWNVYLDDRGFSASTIGLFSAITLGTKIIAPSIWSWVAEHTAGHLRLIQLGAFLTFVCVGLVLFEPGVEQMVVVVFLYSFFWNAILPQFEAVTVTHLGNQSSLYSRIRLWGSVGFVVIVLLLGWVFDHLHIRYLPWFFLAILGSLVVSSLNVPKPKMVKNTISGKQLGAIIATPAIVFFMIAIALQQISHGPYYTFYSIHMADLGYSKSQIGVLWALGVAAEIAVFLGVPKWLPRFGVGYLFVVALALSALRWLGIGFLAHWWPVAVITQLLHAASFGLCHAAAVEFVRLRFSSYPALGQALYSGVSYGLGGAVGALMSGYLWHKGATINFTIAAIASLIALGLIALFVVKEDTRTTLNKINT